MSNTVSEEITQGSDPVLRGLEAVRDSYERVQRSWQDQCRQLEDEVRDARYQATAARREQAAGQDELTAIRRRYQEECDRAERERERARELQKALREIHGALFHGNLPELILQVSLSIAGAQRGLYLAGGPDSARVRAAIDVEGYPQSQPSSFLRALYRRVIDGEDAVLLNAGDNRDGLPQPGRAAERFRNLIAVPIVMRSRLDGMVVVADCKDEFSQDDVSALLNIGSSAGIAVENRRLRAELDQAYLTTVSVLADAIEAKDPYTHGHCELVSTLSRLTAEYLGLPDSERSIVCYAALLHDTGKIGVSDGILNKPGPLLDEERELIKSHVRIGHDLIAHVPTLSTVADVVLHHHEWWNGEGYPDGLAGEDIPLAARIVAAVDSYCAMVTARSYKRAYTVDEAIKELKRCAGSQFDPQVVDVLVRVLELSPEEREPDEDDLRCDPLPGLIPAH